MAPIWATKTGVPRQVLDDVKLQRLLEDLQGLQWDESCVDGEKLALVKQLCTLLTPWTEQERFEEQLDLHEWIEPLNLLDAALTWIVKTYSQHLLLIPPVQRPGRKNRHDFTDLDPATVKAAESLEQIEQVDPVLLSQIRIVLQFLAGLLCHAIQKQLYASVPVVSDLMGAADDGVADDAVKVLTALSLPPDLHRQHSPEHSVHTTALHASSGGLHAAPNAVSAEVHARLMATARAWGTRAMGLGLLKTVTADDSIHGQGALPEAMGEVNFCYYAVGDEGESLREISLSAAEMMAETPSNSPGKKRRRVASPATIESTSDSSSPSASPLIKRNTKSTAELFFLAAEKAGGVDKIPSDRLSSLLADIRLARAFHSQASRCEAVSRRLYALIAILQAHPSQEIMTGYFQAQPELCVELVDLLRPIVSVANVSAAAPEPQQQQDGRLRQDAIAGLVDGGGTQSVPYEIRVLALEALTALVLRRDGSTSALAGSARLSSVLAELGVGKGQYLGMLPTLIRYSLASLSSVTTVAEGKTAEPAEADEAFDVGLAFVEATMAPPLPRKVQVERALQFIDDVLTLTTAVVQTPTGTSALVDCGLIPALLSVVSADPETVVQGLLSADELASCSSAEVHRLKASLRYVTAQAVQILESSIVTHSNALTAFHDLQGVQTLTTRLSREIASTSSLQKPEDAMDVDTTDADGDVEMKGESDDKKGEPRIVCSQRVLVFCVLTCLTVVFHQESNSSSTATVPSGGSELRRKELTDAVIEMMDNVEAYGGYLASLIATLLSDVMNNDPHVVRYVHSSGIAKSFLNMVLGKKSVRDGKVKFEPIVPPVPELVMSIPNVIAALALTEDGAQVVEKANPFPSLIRVFHHPKYAMPQSRCLLNEMTSIVGTGLDEIMRHVDRLKPLVLTAVAMAMTEVAQEAENLVWREEENFSLSGPFDGDQKALEDERSCLIQYVLNFGQLLEQILHKEEHCSPFVDAGGLDAVLRLFPATLPCRLQFLAYLSGLSSPSVSTLHHSTTEDTLSTATKCIEFRYDSRMLIRKLSEAANKHLDELDECQNELFGQENVCFALDQLPREPLYSISESELDRLKLISRYFKCIANVQWITNFLANSIKAAIHRSNESGNGWSRTELGWKKELSCESFETLTDRLSTFYRSSLFEVCRVRTGEDFERREAERVGTRKTGVCYRIRIVCPEGAVVRDGIEIDSCANVGNLEMGDIVDAFDRCVNSSGILRYRTRRGWVSEMTRGHGREAIAEVISLWQSDCSDEKGFTPDHKRRIEAGVPDIRSVAVGVLARGQSCHSELFGSLSTLVIQGVRTLSVPLRPAVFDDGHPGAHLAATMKILTSNLKHGFRLEHIVASMVRDPGGTEVAATISDAGAAMYLGCMLSHFQSCLFDEKRERRMVNFLLLVNLVASESFADSRADGQGENQKGGLFDAMKFVFKHVLADFEARAERNSGADSSTPQQRVGRSVAASFPPLISLLRRLISTPLSSSPIATIMSRMKWKDISRLICGKDLRLACDGGSEGGAFFQPEVFVSHFQLSVSEIVKEAWTDSRMVRAPPFLLHPFASLVGDVMLALEECSKKKSSGDQGSSARSSERGLTLSDLLRGRRPDETSGEPFEASEEAIQQLVDMGFNRDHVLDALENIQSNRIEVAMDYMLSNPPPSPSTVERRRAEREERARRRTEQQEASSGNADSSGQDAPNGVGVPEDSAAQSGDSMERPENADDMDVDNAGTESSGKEENKAKDEAEKRKEVALAELRSWTDDVPQVSCNLLTSLQRPVVSKSFVGEKHMDEGDAEGEALTVVLCSFLLDMCQRYPEKRSDIVEEILLQLKTKLSERTENDAVQYSVPPESEAGAAALSHAAVLVTRALPKTRLLVLKHGLVHSLVSSITTALKSTQRELDDGKETISYPMWMAPSLLLLDIMAQPIVAFSDEHAVKSIVESIPDKEFTQVKTEHEEQVAQLFRTAGRWFTGSFDDSNPSPQTSEGDMEVENDQSDESKKAASPSEQRSEGEMETEKDESNESNKDMTSPFSRIPAYFPLLPSDVTQSCLEICRSLLVDTAGKCDLPAGIAQSTLFLLLRLLRTPGTSSQCLQMGMAEAILALPKDCIFTGNTGLVALIFRRLLEDETTLQAAMETEIRGTVTKLHRKKMSSTTDETPAVPLKSFIEAVTPLLCRDPASFLKAMAVSVAADQNEDSSSDTKVTLLSPSERSKRAERLASELKSSASNLPSSAAVASAQKEDFRVSRSGGSKPKGKHSHKGQKRGSFSKKAKKDKTEIAKNGTQALNESPATHVTHLVLSSITTASADFSSREEDDSFLWVGDLLEILADLILAVPACAAAVHNYRSHRSKEKGRRGSLPSQIRHALGNCPNPPKTFVTFLLHKLLPQDRWSIRNDPQVWDRRKEEDEALGSAIKSKKKKAYRVIKVSHATARVLVALVARPGEGRKRVIADLAFALSGGQLGHGAGVSNSNDVGTIAETYNMELQALLAWGELCLGIAAPRSNGKISEGTAMISIENARLMLEQGVVHSLLYALHRVRLFHPMASNTCGALLLPLEVLTRSSVTDAVTGLVKKEKDSKGKGETDKAVTDAPQNNNKSDEAMAHESFQNSVQSGNGGNIDFEMHEEGSRGPDQEMDEAGEEASDTETQSSEESDEESSGDEDEDSEGDDIDDEEGSEIYDSDGVSSDEVAAEGGWDVNYNDQFGGDTGGGIEDDEAEDEATEQIDGNVDEPWTRIESTGFGGMILGGGRRNGFPGGEIPPGARGFIDAAEAMIGALVRNGGNISGDALVEQLESTLGIRITSGGRTVRNISLRPGGNAGGLEEALGLRVFGAEGGRQPEQTGRGEVIGTLPHVHQRSQPDVGFSAFGRSGQAIEISSMEYVYGGSVVTGGSRNYDLSTPLENEPDSDALQTLTQLDLNLFPEGPASAASARSQHSLHPLLCGVDLPPINSLVSDLLPHGVRATRRGQMTTRPPGDWTNTSFSGGGQLVSTSNGNIIRTNRLQSGTFLGSGLSSSNMVGPVGWTDDGLPVDATVEEFSSAFERALVETTTQRGRPDEDQTAAPQGEGQTGAHEQAPTADTRASNENEGDAAEQEHQQPENEQEHDGDGVASSLATGLRLSPGSEAGAGDICSMDAEGGDRPAARSTREDDPMREDTRPSDSTQQQLSHSADAAMLDAEEDSSPPDDGESQIEQHGADQQASNAREDPGEPGESGDTGNGEAAAGNAEESGGDAANQASTGSELVCPPDIDPEVFNSLPREMQQDCVDQYNATQELATQLDGSTLDPEVLAALPEDMRREVIEQDRRERQSREQEQAPADPSHAEEMDNASFIASLAPELRAEILLTADETLLNSLPPGLLAEAQILRERASVQQRRMYDEARGAASSQENLAPGAVPQHATRAAQHADVGANSSRRRMRSGKLRVDCDRSQVVYLPESLSPPIAKTDIKVLVRLMYLLSPVRPPRLLQKVFHNLCVNPSLRTILSAAFVKLLHEDGPGAAAAIDSLEQEYTGGDKWRKSMDSLFTDEDEFPPSILLGAAPDFPDLEAFNLSISASLLRRRQGLGTAAAVAANLPKSAGGAGQALPPVVSARLVDTVQQLCKSSSRFCLHTLVTSIPEDGNQPSTVFEKLLELLDKPMFSKSSANLEQLLTLLEAAVAPLSHLAKPGEEIEIPQRDIDAATAAGKEWVDAPRVVVSQRRLQVLCSILRMETCRDAAFTKVNTIVRRLCRVEMNRGYVLAELASVAQALGVDAISDLRALRLRMDTAVAQHQQRLSQGTEEEMQSATPGPGVVGSISGSVTLSTSTSEVKLLRVMQTLQALCSDRPEDHGTKKNENSIFVTDELVELLRQMQFDSLWDELSSCLKVVQVLEGVKTFEEEERKESEETETDGDASGDETSRKTKKLRNSAAGLLTRFLPSIEAFFIANASATRPVDGSSAEGASATGQDDVEIESLVGGKRLLEFVSTNKVLLNALIRSNSGLLDKGLRALVQVPRCRVFLDFDVKRQWFKTQMKRLRQLASRRHGSLRLHIRRKYVFEDAYHQLLPRNADEMRGRLHITFRNEEGVDAGGLSREFFGILAKEMFNPNYALFTSTEDGCTFQPNPNSVINPDHLSYFRFVGRVVGKAVADGYLLDAHFTRSLYKHMLGLKPTHHDMEAIDPDYYRNLKTILEFKLEDIGLDLTFSIEDHSFGRSRVIDLIPNGRKVPVTEENKEEYVRLVCQHRMTTAIQSQIKSYLDGFYELVSPELVAVFTPRELELLISGLPDIDVHDLKKNTDYVHWKATDKEIGWFWNIMFSLSRNEKAAFLQFVTGSSKVPLAGFAELQGMRGTQKFSIHKAGGSKGALMSAHTCFNSLDLPVYKSEEEMREKLLYAINEGGGAFLFA